MRRLGAAKALTKMADKLADEKDLVSAYLLEALMQALLALQLAEHDARGTGTRAQLAEAIKVSFCQQHHTMQPWTRQAYRPLQIHSSTARQAASISAYSGQAVQLSFLAAAWLLVMQAGRNLL